MLQHRILKLINMKRIYLLMVGIVLTLSVQSQESKWPKVDKSALDAVYYPMETAWRNYLEGDKRTQRPRMKLVFSRPMKNDRVIFGELVPYGKEWRLGANEATMITFYKGVDIGGTSVDPGTYTVFATPTASDWTLTFSSQSGIWGGENRDKTKDVASIKVATEKVSNVQEALSMTFQEKDAQTVNLVIEWDQTRVTAPIGLNPVQFSDMDKSVMDMAHYPSKSAYTNYLEGEERDITPKVQVTYSRPAKKGRVVFGELLNEGSVWRLGANEATEIVFYQKTNVGGTDVARGRYAMFAKLNKGSWDIILSKDYPVWGSHNRDESLDKYTINVPTTTDSEVVEHLSIIFDEKDDKSADMIIGWDTTRAAIPMKF